MTPRCLAVAAGLLAASCAAPPVTLYTLDVTGPAAGAARPAYVIEIPRLTVPDYLDTQDILIRHGAVVARSHAARWASRLSVAATELIAGCLASSHPDALVTDQPQTTAPAYRILINISRLDLAIPLGARDGAATLDADWLIIPHDPAKATKRDRSHIEIAGPLQTDQDVVTLTTAVLDRLASRIDIARGR